MPFSMLTIQRRDHCILWMTTLFGMLITGAAEFTSSDHEPEDEAAEPEEPQTVDHADPAQFYSVRIEPVQSEPQPEIPTDPLRGSAADDSLIGHARRDRINGYGGNDTITGQSGDDDL